MSITVIQIHIVFLVMEEPHIHASVKMVTRKMAISAKVSKIGNHCYFIAAVFPQ